VIALMAGWKLGRCCNGDVDIGGGEWVSKRSPPVAV